MKDLLTTREVAAIFEVDIRTVQRWCKAGKLPAERLGRGVFRITRETVRQLQTRQRIAPLPKPPAF